MNCECCGKDCRYWDLNWNYYKFLWIYQVWDNTSNSAISSWKIRQLWKLVKSFAFSTVPTHISVTFNRGKPLPNLLFVPTKCEVMNKENNSQIWQIWDSGYKEEEMGTCDKSPSPVGFKMISSPNNQDSKSKAFYGMTYQGEFLYFYGYFSALFDAILRLWVWISRRWSEFKSALEMRSNCMSCWYLRFCM